MMNKLGKYLINQVKKLIFMAPGKQPQVKSQDTLKEDITRSRVDIYSVVLADHYFDIMTDNDDLGDQETIIEVKYDSSGNILESRRPWKTKIDSTGRYFYLFQGCRIYKERSDLGKLYHFYQTCGIECKNGVVSREGAKKYSTYNKFQTK